MALVPYTITAIERDTADADTSGKQVVVGAVCSMFVQPSDTVVLLYDDAAGSNPSTAKATGTNGQVVVYVEPGEYRLTTNGISSFATIGGASVLTTTELIASNFRFEVGDVVNTTGFYTAGDGGGHPWKLTSSTGLTNQSPAQLGLPLLNDALGKQWELVGYGAINLKSVGAAGDYLLSTGAVNPSPTNDTLACVAALASEKDAYAPYGHYYVPDQKLIIGAISQTIKGDGEYQSVFVTDGAQSVLAITTNFFGSIVDVGVLSLSAATPTAHGIEVGLIGGGGGSRATLSGARAQGFGGDGVIIYDGNLGTLNDVACLENAGHGLHFTDTNPDNNAWNQSGRLDLRGNGGNGLHLPEGAGVADANAPKSNNFTFVSAQENTGFGLYIGTRNNIINYYSENNTGGSAKLMNLSGAEGNILTAVEGGLPTLEGENTTQNNNILINNNFNARYSAAYKNMFIEDNFRMERAGRAGNWNFKLDETIDRDLKIIGTGSTSNAWAVRFLGGEFGTEDQVSVFSKQFIGQLLGEWTGGGIVTLPAGPGLIDISGGNTFILSNASPVISNGVLALGWVAGKKFTIIGDGFTEITGGNVVRKAGSPATPALNDYIYFQCDHAATGGIREIGNSL